MTTEPMGREANAEGGGQPPPPAMTRRQMIGAAVLAVGSGAALGQPAAPSTGPTTIPVPPPGQPGVPEYVDLAPPGVAAQGMPVLGYGAPLAKTPLAPITIKRRAVGPRDVQVDVLWAGVCHSDIHQVDNDWKNTVYPCVPGHEIVGKVSQVGPEVTRFKVGETVAIGTIVDSCGTCKNCKAGLEQYCEGPKGATNTYNGPFKPNGTNTYGGYSARMVVTDKWVFKVPPNLDLKGVPPLLCAGLTTYSPLRHWKVQPGHKVGVVGLGGLGHMAVKLAAAMGAEVTVFSTSPEKEADARAFGAKDFVLHKDASRMKALELSQDLVLNTVPEPHDVNPFVKTLARDGSLVVVGLLVPFAAPTDNNEVAMHRRSVAGSLVGGAAEAQEVLDFCGRHNITASVQPIGMADVNEAYPRVKSGKVRYRYVIDVANTLKPA